MACKNISEILSHDKILNFRRQYLMVPRRPRVCFGLCAGFDITFQKWLGSFPNKNNCKTDLKCWPPWLGEEKIFHFRLHKTAFNSISFTISYWTTSNLYPIYYKTFVKKNWIKEWFSTAIKCSASPPDNYTCSRGNGGATPFFNKRRR